MSVAAVRKLPGAEIPPGPRVDRGTQARTALIAAAIQEFGEFGPEGASSRKIAQLAGQNIAAIAYYFGNKQGLYLAVMRQVVVAMTRRTGDVLDDIEAFLTRETRAPAQCLARLQRLLNAMLYGSDEVVALSQLIVREQTHPTAGFEILFKGWLERPHRLGAALIAAYLDGDPDAPEAALRYHMLLGSVLGFRVARQTLLRRLGWRDITDAEKADIARMTAEHVEFILKGLRSKRQRLARDDQRRA